LKLEMLVKAGDVELGDVELGDVELGWQRFDA
jgi:hypothetical protein